MDLTIALEAFYGEHRLCGEMDGGVEDECVGYRVWMSCSTCATKLDLRFTDGDERVWKETPRSNQP